MSVSAARAALVDAGWPDWEVDPERVAVILGNALGGEKHYHTTMRIHLPEFARDLGNAPSFAALPADVRAAILEEWHQQSVGHLPEINEDTMPGELANIMAGRVASLFNFRGPNFITDAACASALAAMSSAVQGLGAGHYDAVITGGVDRNMGVNAFVKFCKIGALSATGTRPFDAGADGFVMGEGAAMFVLKRLADAERSGRPDLRSPAGSRWLERRQGQGHHRTQPGRAAAGRRAGVGQRRRRSLDGRHDRGARHLHRRR